jgi:hypothetical protein
MSTGRDSTYSHLVGVLAALAAILLACLGFAYWKWPEAALDHKAADLEIFKATLQVVTVLVLGQLVVLLVKDRESAKQQAAVRQALLTNWLNLLVKTYVDVKKHRRLLRASTRLAPGVRDGLSGRLMDRSVYDAEMRALNEIELDCEVLWHDIASVAPKGVPFGPELEAKVRNMKDYLRALLHQYEGHLGTFDQKESISIDEMGGKESNTLADFVGPAKGARFHKVFIEDFREAQRLLRRAIALAD